MEDQFYKKLVERYLDKSLNDEELEVFIHLLNENKLDFYLREAMDNDKEALLDLDTPIKKIQHRYNFIYKAAAVVVISALGLLGYNHFSKTTVNKVLVENSISEIQPATNKAVLILSNGERIFLSDSIGTVMKNGEVSDINSEKGVVIYDATPSEQKQSSLQLGGFNTISTPKGGIYQVVLPDKSKVWLNNESSITFPVQFTGNERRVEITGEVYFEVASNKEKPFRVLSRNQVVEVLGTHFNVNAYHDEPDTKTTLLEGSVNVKTLSQSKMLKPGFQSIIRDKGNIEIAVANIDATIAWKKGVFEFDKVNIQAIMRQIARWYDIDIEYRGTMPKDEFVGKIRRSSDINEVLEVLKYGNVKFKFEGRKLIIE